VVTADFDRRGRALPPEDPPRLVARKLLRVNLSDLAAKGATPFGYLLSIAWPVAWGEAEGRLSPRGWRRTGRPTA
jgi:thiamine-monophosphate kinase